MSGSSPIENLPADMKQELLKYLTAADLAKTAQLSKTMGAAVDLNNKDVKKKWDTMLDRSKNICSQGDSLLNACKRARKYNPSGAPAVRKSLEEFASTLATLEQVFSKLSKIVKDQSVVKQCLINLEKAQGLWSRIDTELTEWQKS